LQSSFAGRDIPFCGIRHKPSNRAAMSCDHDLFTLLDTIEQRAESILCLKCADRLRISQ
jgi:hypothetical protein